MIIRFKIMEFMVEIATCTLKIKHGKVHFDTFEHMNVFDFAILLLLDAYKIIPYSLVSAELY